jgi:hypothetical protein
MIRKCAMIAGLAAMAGLGLDSQARAGLIPTVVTVTPDSGNFRWTYAVVVTTDVQVKSGDFFTIYDFNGLVPGSAVAPAGWSASTPMLGVTPSGTSPSDNPAVPNITFTYSGPPINGSAGLGNFWALSNTNVSETSNFTSQSHTQVNGHPEANITSTDVPVPGGGDVLQTPEPSAIGMLGISLPMLGFLRFLRRRLKRA